MVAIHVLVLPRAGDQPPTGTFSVLDTDQELSDPEDLGLLIGLIELQIGMIFRRRAPLWVKSTTFGLVIEGSFHSRIN